MPNWFRLAGWVLQLVVLAIVAIKPDLPIFGGLLMILVLTVMGGSCVAINLLDRHASHADDPTTLNLNR